MSCHETNTILDKIIARKRERLNEALELRPTSLLKAQIANVEPPRDFVRSIAQKHGVSLIAEIKRASPSKGLLAEHADVASLAQAYERGGARGISVVTEQDFFLGRLEDISLVKGYTSLPVLRKDFIFDQYQVYESRAAGADAILLICSVLEPRLLKQLLRLASDLGMASLVEVHTEEEVEKAIKAGAEVIGINNRDLNTFVTDLSTTERLAPMITMSHGQQPTPSKDVIVVSESGIKGRCDVLRVEAAGAKAVLVGEALMSVPSIEGIEAKARELTGLPQPYESGLR